MTEDQSPAAELLTEMRAFAATLRGSQAVGALRLIEHLDPASAPAVAPRDTDCAHGVSMFGAYCADCDAGKTQTHAPVMRTYTNPGTYRRTVLCAECRGFLSNYRHTGESA